MPSDVVFKTFRTYKHPYVYDRHTNSLIRLSEDEYSELTQVEKGEMPAERSSVIRKYQEQGMFMPNIVERIEHPGTIVVEHYLKARVKQLTLQVTQQCNLRCEYCIYSGVYNTRTHSNKRMSWETAKKAIDFFIARTTELAEITIGFYGGEPLLELDLIKRCVEYAKSKIEGKAIKFNVSTNGTLLVDNVVDYLVKNDFLLSVSLDGSKEEHDVTRKFENGEGSFDIIIGNMERLRIRYPEYDKKTSIMSTINPHADLGCTLEYFSTDELFNDKHVIFNQMNETGLDMALNYDKRHFEIRNYEYIKMLFASIGKLELSTIAMFGAGA